MPSSVVNPWCPTCGDEFQPHMRTCPDCEVALRNDGPPPSSLPGARPIPAGPPPVRGSSAVDLAHLTPGSRRTISLRLQGEDIFHEWRGNRLSYPTARHDTVVEVIEWASPPEGQLRPARRAEWAGGLDDGGRRGDAAPVLASRRARLAAAVLDYVIESLAATAVAVAAWALYGFGDGLPLAVLVLIGMSTQVYRLGAIGRFGQTIGKYLIGIKVIAAAGQPAGWGRAVIRVFSPWTFWVALGLTQRSLAEGPVLGPVFSSLLWLVGVAYLLPILWDPYCRGLHDRAAGTIVVRAR